jgi:hypothetical protein
MPELLRDSSHGNHISVLYLETENIFRKISREDSGRNLLVNEHAGIEWYSQKSTTGSCPLTCTLWETDEFTRLDLVNIPGKQVFYNAAFSRTFPYLESCLEHYFDVWPSFDVVPCHGDLTLDNVMFTDADHPVFFDWEHFSDEGECWGFDIAYLLLSAIVLPSPGKIQVNTREQALFLDVWESLRSKGLLLELFENPVGYFKNIFTSKRHWQKIVSRSPNKLFPMWMTPEDEVYISKIIRQGN